MTRTLERPTAIMHTPPRTAGGPPPPPLQKAKRAELPRWLRTPPKRPVQRRPAPTPRDIRWWVGVAWLLLSTLLIGFVGHVTIMGALQHGRSQHVLYQQLRTQLALATTPTGQLDFNGDLVANGTPVALISIDRLGIAEVVVQGTTPTDLMAGPGHRRDTVMPGQEGTSVIMGRQATYGGPFGRIAALVNGDVIEVTTGQGVARYKVFGVRQEGDLLPVTLEEGEGRLELITADGVPLSPSGAIHVDARLTSDPEMTPSPSFTSAVLDPSEEAMGLDSSGWFELLFWFQWLVVAVVALRWVRSKWGMWQTWVIGLPIVISLGAFTAGATMNLLPNLL